MATISEGSVATSPAEQQDELSFDITALLVRVADLKHKSARLAASNKLLKDTQLQLQQQMKQALLVYRASCFDLQAENARLRELMNVQLCDAALRHEQTQQQTLRSLVSLR